ncbi:MAG TPA: protein kinase, partial [Anaerolineae bacterium]|nr:protein kinase [Anaerolineae bacterium]
MMALLAGETILEGKYRILKLLGEGGAARVWLAEEPEFGGRKVAIKELKLEQLTASEVELQERHFRQEIEMAALLEQARVPNVVRAVTLERMPDGARLLVMEYAAGGSLSDRLARAPQGMPVDEVLRVAEDLCQALQAFHGLAAMPVHRDIKPSNILFDTAGKAYLSDFGVCQLPGRSGRTLVSGEPHPGTPLYMAPEQLASPGPLGPQADIFALGCVLFEMLTGKAYRRVKPRTLVSALRPDVPGWLSLAVKQAVEEDPWVRFANAGALAAALRERKLPPRPMPEPKTVVEVQKPTRLLPRLAAGAALLIGLAVLGFFGWRYLERKLRPQPTAHPGATEVAAASSTMAPTATGRTATARTPTRQETATPGPTDSPMPTASPTSVPPTSTPAATRTPAPTVTATTK